MAARKRGGGGGGGNAARSARACGEMRRKRVSTFVGGAAGRLDGLETRTAGNSCSLECIERDCSFWIFNSGLGPGSSIQ